MDSSEFEQPVLIYPEYDEFVSRPMTKWRRLFQFSFENAKLEDFNYQCSRLQWVNTEFCYKNSFVAFNGITEWNGEQKSYHCLIMHYDLQITIFINPTTHIKRHKR